MKKSVREEKLKQLEFLIGRWEVEVIHPLIETHSIYGQTTFEWMEKKQFIVQRSTMNQPEFPSSTLIYDYDSNTGNYIQHYFDSRGVTQLYNMTLEDNVWKLVRTKPDFSRLDFHQRFIGKINETRDAIDSYWEKSDDGLNWEHDFKLIYRKVI